VILLGTLLLHALLVFLLGHGLGVLLICDLHSVLMGLIVELHPLILQTGAFCRFSTSINSLSAVSATKSQTSRPSSSPNCLDAIAR
jgi:hypothetical protein